jgi:hypothetical protein
VNLIYRRNLNELPASATAYSASRKPYPLYNQVIWSDNGGNDFYNGLELAATRKFGTNLSFGAGYTFARDLTDTQDSGTGGTSFGGQVIQDQYNRAVEKANNGLVLRHRGFGYAVYVLPVGKGQRFLGNANRLADGLLGGWQTGWNVNLQSGQFFTPSFSSFDPSNTNTIGGRPDRITGAALYPANQNINNWFNAAAFSIPGCLDSDPLCKAQPRVNVGRFGNAQQNILTGPGIRNLDFSLMKWFHITEKARVQFRLIMVDALNHPNFANPRANISSTGTVGTIISTARVLNGEPATREIDLGLRVVF